MFFMDHIYYHSNIIWLIVRSINCHHLSLPWRCMHEKEIVTMATYLSKLKRERPRWLQICDCTNMINSLVLPLSNTTMFWGCNKGKTWSFTDKKHLLGFDLAWAHIMLKVILDANESLETLSRTLNHPFTT